MASGRGTDHEKLNSISLARIINKVHGGPVISAMEVDQLDEEWIDAFLGVAVDLPRKQARQKAIQRKFEQFEQDYTKQTGLKVH